jgi:hypothetical protein
MEAILHASLMFVPGFLGLLTIAYLSEKELKNGKGDNEKARETNVGPGQEAGFGNIQ